jgi:hypothetical protein
MASGNGCWDDIAVAGISTTGAAAQMTTDKRSEREPFGITYDRLRLHRLFERIAGEQSIRTALEVPAGGAKAMPSLYSLGLARCGTEVTLLNPDPGGLAVWERLGLPYRVAAAASLSRTGLSDEGYDLVWNFVTLGSEPDFESILGEMTRLTRGLVLTVHCNGYNYGYPWHRFLHWALKIPWMHGQTDWFFPRKVRNAYIRQGLKPIGLFLLDMPWWPDPPGFRDVRLHLSGREESEVVEWVAPIEQIYAGDPAPFGLRLLSTIEDLPLPRIVRWPFSHLFAVLGTKNR